MRAALRRGRAIASHQAAKPLTIKHHYLVAVLLRCVLMCLCGEEDAAIHSPQEDAEEHRGLRGEGSFSTHACQKKAVSRTEGIFFRQANAKDWRENLRDER
jgi:hypothetical protein